eukprot:CAMPEP_0185179028 /NCGR_PEP_ID=MMETSP1139-20130426/31808_1 /TAXON_ID=298111 /ORGANISM="Pavlova sp., Strain CCMP459" /LENGTH=214 /DNA_ID=CAMNT_0027744863 /DNA_START=45 /DNA_END=690 /DNA_ORIENTATION=+
MSTFSTGCQSLLGPSGCPLQDRVLARCSNVAADARVKVPRQPMIAETSSLERMSSEATNVTPSVPVMACTTEGMRHHGDSAAGLSDCLASLSKGRTSRGQEGTRGAARQRRKERACGPYHCQKGVHRAGKRAHEALLTDDAKNARVGPATCRGVAARALRLRHTCTRAPASDDELRKCTEDTKVTWSCDGATLGRRSSRTSLAFITASKMSLNA